MTRKFLWELLAAVIAFGAAGCGTEGTPISATVSGQPAGAEETGGGKNAEGKAVTETSVSQSTEDDGEAYIIRTAVVLSDSHLHNTVLDGQTREAKEKTNGRLILKVTGSSQLGGERDHTEGVQLGNIRMAQASSAAANGFLNDFSLLLPPYFFKDHVEIGRVFNGPMGDELFAELEGIGIKGSTWLSNGFRNVYTKNIPVTTPVDMKGLRIRAMENDVMIATLNAVGASGAPMAYSELYSTIQQGVMDGAENALGNVYSDGYYEIYRNVPLTEHSAPPGVVTTSQKSYDSPPDDLKECLTESAIRFDRVECEIDERLQEEMEKKLEGRGAQINEVGKQNLIDTTASIYAECASGISDIVKALAEKELGKSSN